MFSLDRDLFGNLDEIGPTNNPDRDLLAQTAEQLK